MEWIPMAFRVLQTALGAVADVLDGEDVDAEQLANEISNNVALLSAYLKKMRLDRDSLPERWAAEIDAAADVE